MVLLTDFTEIPDTILIEGIVISLVGYVIVFVALVILYFFFFYLSKVINLQIKLKLRREGKIKTTDATKDFSIPGEVAAAISLALYMASELHDEESEILTIKKVSRTYSPWSSKIYGLNGLNR